MYPSKKERIRCLFITHCCHGPLSLVTTHLCHSWPGVAKPVAEYGPAGEDKPAAKEDDDDDDFDLFADDDPEVCVLYGSFN